MEKLIFTNTTKIQYLENKLLELENYSKKLSEKYQNLATTKAQDCEDETYHRTCKDDSSQVMSAIEVPHHKKLDQHGYPVCWQKDFKPNCCSHKHDPGRGGRNVPPDLSQRCHHRCRN